MWISDLLAPFVLENEAYTAELNQDLKECKSGFREVDTHADVGTRIVEALRAEEHGQAVELVLQHFEVSSEAKQLRSIRTRWQNGETLSAVVQGLMGPSLLKEIVDTVAARVQQALEKLEELVEALGEMGGKATSKFESVSDDWGGWGWRERIGTPLALKKLASKAKQTAGSAVDAQKKLNALSQALDGLRKSAG